MKLSCSDEVEQTRQILCKHIPWVIRDGGCVRLTLHISCTVWPPCLTLRHSSYTLENTCLHYNPHTLVTFVVGCSPSNKLEQQHMRSFLCLVWFRWYIYHSYLFRCVSELVMVVIIHISTASDTYIQKTKKSYIDSRARRNLGSINTELQDVQRIMVANIEEVLQRGEALSGEFTLLLLCISLSLWSFLFVLNALPPISLSGSTRLQGQQLVLAFQEVQERCQVSEYPLHLCQAGGGRGLLYHAHCLCTLLVALRETAEEKRRIESWAEKLHRVCKHKEKLSCLP